jgi:hypothetical protein
MGKDDDIAGLKLDGLSIRQLHERSAIDEQMIEDHVCRPRGELATENVGCGCRKTPRSGEFRAEEHGAVQLDSAQNLGERIHSVLRTVGKVSWPPRKRIFFREPFEQIMATLGHGGCSRRTAQL